MSSPNTKQGAQAAVGCFRLTWGCAFILLPFVLILGFVLYTVISGIADIGHTKQTCSSSSTSCSNSNDNNGGSGGSDGGDGGDDGGDGGGDGGGD
jgi:hypothetical protein